MNKKYFAFLFFISFFIALVGSLQITNFDGYSTPENLTFTGDQNLTRNISIYKFANVTSATMNLSGYEIDDCYQESADTSNQTGVDGNCGLNYSGEYTGTNYIGDYFNDGNWNSAVTALIGGGYINITYEKPEGAKFARWIVKHEAIDDTTLLILSSSSCWNYNEDKLFLYVNASSIDPSTFVDWMCKDGDSSYTSLSYNAGYGNMFEEAVNWVLQSYPENVTLYINNTQIWNHTGEFNSIYSPNQTDDFSSTLNTALNSGACDCSSCSISGNDCIIEILFHSDTAGILEYSNLNITYDNPSITLIEPQDSHTYGTNESLELNFSKTNFTEVDCYYNIQNSTDAFVVSNTSITDCLNTTFNVSQGDGTFNLTIYMNNSNGIMAQDSNIFYISINSPAINLNAPTDNEWLNYGENIYFNFTATDSDGIDTCLLYSNFTGTWGINETFTGIISGTQNHTIKNLTDNSYLWNVWCNDSVGNGGFALNNFTTTIDTTDPTVSIDSITTTAGSQTISFNSTESDTNLDSCKYSIYNSTGGIDGTNENISMTCNSNPHSATTSSYGNFTLRVYAIDLAENENYDELNFTTSASSGETTTGGGGSTIIIPEGNWTINTIGEQTSYNILMPLDSSRTLNLEFENFAEEEKELTLSCEDINGSLCQYVTFETESFILPVLKDVRTQKKFTLTIPENTTKGDFSFNIKAIDQNSAEKSITVFASVGTGNPLSQTISKLGLSTSGGFPYIFIYLPFLLLTLFATIIILPEKFPLKSIWVFIATLFIPFIGIYFI